MRPQTVTVSSQATSTPIIVNWRERDFKLGVIAALASGASLTYSVEVSYDDPENFTDASDYNTNGTWIAADSMSGLTATEDTLIESPVRAIRIDVTAFTSGSVTLTVLQAT